MSLQYKRINTSLKYVLGCIFLLLAALPTFAQRGKLFDTDNQLSSNFATQVIQDHNGFIWIATRNGLNVYDGYNFTIFDKNNKNNLGFSNNYINCMAVDHQGNIIIGSNSGIMLYDQKRFHPLDMYADGKKRKTYINDILTRKNGEVWICTSGYGIMRMIGHQRCERIKGIPKSHNYIFSAFEDQEERVWIITEDSNLMRLEKNGKLTQHFSGTENVKAKYVRQDSKGNIYLCTEQNGLYVQKKGSSSFMHIDIIGCPSLASITITKDDRVYLGTDGNGILVYNPQNNMLAVNPFYSNQVKLAKSKVNGIIEDTQGNLWLCMFQKGVFLQTKQNYDFAYMGYKLGNQNLIGDYCVNSVALGKDGKIWVGTDKDGVYSLADNCHSAKHYTNTPITILSMSADHSGNIWIGAYREGCGYIDPAGNYHAVNLKPGTTLSVFGIQVDKLDNIWFATMGEGLFCLRKDGSIKNFKQHGNAGNDHTLNSIPNDYLNKLCLSHDESKLYVATSIGLACLDIKTESWLSTFGVNCINQETLPHCIMCDKKGNIWYGTEDGVFCYSPKDYKHPKIYTIQEGLPSNSVSLFAEDGLGNIWIGTCHGLCKLDIRTQKIESYYVGNGLQSNEFSTGAVASTTDGRLFVIGGTGGINWFNPLKIKQHDWQAKIYISNFIIGNKVGYSNMESGIYTLTHKPIFATSEFNLSHEDNTFTIRLSTLTYNNVEQIRYAYSINGEEWHQTKPGQNDLSFSHMPAGTYKFRVKAIVNDQESDIREIKVIVHPAWYASSWAKIVYVLIFCALVFLYIQHRKKKEEDRLILQQHIHAEEMGEAKLKFFMNISHEIRTPLTLIITPLLSLIKEDKDPSRQGIYDIIRKNSERILHLINQMMDLRKIDKGQMVMHMTETDMVTFMQDEYELFKHQAATKNIDFKFTHDADSLHLWIDRNNFDKVIMNLLSNAFKFTHTGGNILMSLTHSQRHAYISVKDNGIGISEDKLETIFQRFYQSPTSAKDRNIGTGIGLDLARSLVELHYGTIVAHNNNGKNGEDFAHGSEFVIRLPLGHEHLKPEEIILQPEDKPNGISEEDREELLEEMAHEEPISKNVGTKPHIFLVEDDEAILEYLQEQLKTDFQVGIFHNGKEALPEIIKQQPHLVISDVMMPEMDGTTLCTKLKSNVNTNHIPVILLTAMSREEDQLAGLQTGADAYIVKPFNMDILRRTILNLLSVRRTLQNKFTGNESQEDKIDDVKIDSPDKLLLNRIMEVINKNMMNEELSVEMIAQEVGISRVHLHRKMKELTNQTPHSFIRNIRLKRAAKLLKEAHQSVTEVMYVCGFSNPASFSTMFKNMYGCSPRDYMTNQATGAK